VSARPASPGLSEETYAVAFGTPDQIERYPKPTLRGERADATAAPAPRLARSRGPPSGRRPAGASGAEKWFVASDAAADCSARWSRRLRILGLGGAIRVRDDPSTLI
jgi:hypothetical protein